MHPLRQFIREHLGQLQEMPRAGVDPVPRRRAVTTA
jgi:hypothetical protein